MNATGIAHAYGTAHNQPGRSTTTDCPCCGYKNALSVTEKNGQRLYYCHAGCAPSDVWAVVRGTAGDWERKPVYRAKVKSGDKALDDYIRRLWKSSLPAPGTLVATYLSMRGITMDIPASLRFLPRHKHQPSGTRWPIMLACVTDHAGNLRAIHRTYIAADGKEKSSMEPPKMTLAEVGGYATHLAPAGETLAVTEGIETGLSVQQATGIPTWAALSAGGISGLILPPLPLAREVLICADHDANGVGQRAADHAAARWLNKGRRVRIALPPVVGQDFNDLLCGAV